jgi:hypothetical protein
MPGVEEPIDLPVRAEIKDADGIVVCVVTAVWRIERRG